MSQKFGVPNTAPVRAIGIRASEKPGAFDIIQPFNAPISCNPFERFVDAPEQIIVGAQNVIHTFHTLNAHVTRVQTSLSDVLVYESAASPDAFKTFVISIGPIVIEISIDLTNLAIDITVYLQLLFVNVQIAKASGSLKDGVTLSIRYPGVLGGTLTFQLSGNDVMLIYDFTAFSLEYKGKIKIFTI